MSDPNHPQDQPSAASQSGRVPLPRDKELEDELQRVKEELDAPKQDKPVAPSELEDAGAIVLEQGRDTVRRDRLTLRRGEEEISDLEFRRRVLIAVLAILGLIAGASTAIIATGIATHDHALLIPALGPLSGSGLLSVGAWRIYAGTMPAKREPEPTGGGP